MVSWRAFLMFFILFVENLKNSFDRIFLNDFMTVYNSLLHMFLDKINPKESCDLLFLCWLHSSLPCPILTHMVGTQYHARHCTLPGLTPNRYIVCFRYMRQSIRVILKISSNIDKTIFQICTHFHSSICSIHPSSKTGYCAVWDWIAQFYFCIVGFQS